MNRIRDIETVTCCVCGKECDKIRTREIFTGRVRYIYALDARPQAIRK